jgi:hypothetical protein
MSSLMLIYFRSGLHVTSSGIFMANNDWYSCVNRKHCSVTAHHTALIVSHAFILGVVIQLTYMIPKWVTKIEFQYLLNLNIYTLGWLLPF